MDKKIIVVDDEVDILEVLQRFLSDAGYSFSGFDNARDAIDAVKKEPFDLAIVDLKLGEESGIDVMKTFHQIDPEVPVVILTGYGTVESAVEAMSIGAMTYLTKPFIKDVLLFEVKNAIERAGLLREMKKLRKEVGESNIDDLISYTSSAGVQMKQYEEAINVFELQYIIRLIDASGGDIAKAVESAGLSEEELTGLLHKHGIGLSDSSNP
ncbi:MAG: response regulator [Thermodesulfovibrionales bacterium]